jgi:dienelactone hydrolase
MQERDPDWLRGFEAGSLAHCGVMRPYYCIGRGPPVLLLHEIFGLTEQVACFARRLAERAGVSVYLPVFFGNPATSGTIVGRAAAVAQMCIRREFALFAAHRTGRAVDVVRALAEIALRDRNAQKFGLIGLCLTGNFALAMMCDRRLAAPVTSEPSLPAAFTAKGKAQPGADCAAVACAKERLAGGETLLGFRFRTDWISSVHKFEGLERLLGPRFDGRSIELPPGVRRGHSVFTASYDDTPGSSTRDAFEALVEFLRPRLGA